MHNHNKHNSQLLLKDKKRRLFDKRFIDGYDTLIRNDLSSLKKSVKNKDFTYLLGMDDYAYFIALNAKLENSEFSNMFNTNIFLGGKIGYLVITDDLDNGVTVAIELEQYYSKKRIEYEPSDYVRSSYYDYTNAVMVRLFDENFIIRLTVFVPVDVLLNKKILVNPSVRNVVITKSDTVCTKKDKIDILFTDFIKEELPKLKLYSKTFIDKYRDTIGETQYFGTQQCFIEEGAIHDLHFIYRNFKFTTLNTDDYEEVEDILTAIFDMRLSKIFLQKNLIKNCDIEFPYCVDSTISRAFAGNNNKIISKK